LVNDPGVKQELIDNTNAAVERGAFGSPTFFVNDHIYFGKDRLWEVEEAINLDQQTENRNRGVA
ncbi:DsbA family protein, partial [Sphingobium chlorophenolicum]